MWETQHNTAGLGHSKTQTLLATLRTQSQPQVVSCVFSEAELLSQTVGGAQFCRIWSCFSGRWTTYGWVTSYRSLGHCDWGFTNDYGEYSTQSHKPQETGGRSTQSYSSTKLAAVQPNWAVCDSKTKTQHATRKQGMISEMKWITYLPTHVLLKVNLSCTSLKTTKLWSKWYSKDEVPRWDMCREVTESLLIRCLTESTWNQRSKSNMLTPKTNSQTSWQRGISHVMNGITFCVCSTSWFWRHILAAILESVLSIQRAPCDWCHVESKRKDQFRRRLSDSSNGSPVAKARPANLVMQSQCKEDVSPQRSGSLVNLENDNNRKRVSLATRNWGSYGPNFEVEGSQMHRQENVNLAVRKLGQKDFSQPKCEEDSSSTGTLDAISPIMENMRFSDHQYMERYFNENRRNWEGLQ